MVDSSTPTKVCITCQQEKPLTEFRKDPECRLGRKNRCRSCSKVYDREREAKPEVRERKRAQARVRLAADREHFREKNRQAYHRNAEKYREGQRQYRHSRTDIAWLDARERTRRQMIRAATGVLPERVDYALILERDGYVCHLCKQPIDPSTIRNIEFDHKIPTSKGGTHTADNIAVAHIRCNAHKHTTVI